MTRFLIPAALLAALGGCVDIAQESEVGTTSTFQMSQAQMPSYCREEAAERFGVTDGGAITVGDAVQAGGSVTVSGSTANGALPFTCSFTADGDFVGIQTG